MSALLDHPEVASMVSGVAGAVIDPGWSQGRRDAALATIRLLVVRAGQIAGDGNRSRDPRVAAENALDVALNLARIADPKLAASVSATPLEASTRMQALIVGMIEAMRHSAGRAET